MRTRRMGRDGPEVPVVCFGTWPLGGAYGSVEEDTAVATMHAAMDAGLTFIDTAEGYMNAEAIIGKSIVGRRDELFIATKVSTDDHSTEHINSAIENSLRKMRIDYVDLYQLHRATARPIEDTMADLLKLRDAGKLRYIGISNFSADQIDAAAKAGPVHSGQPRYNMLFRETEDDLLPAYQANGIGVMAHSVLAKGLLGGRYKPGHRFPSDDERATWPAFRGESFQRTYEMTERLKAWAADHGRNSGAAGRHVACQSPGRLHEHRRREADRGHRDAGTGRRVGADRQGPPGDRRNTGRPQALHRGPARGQA